MYKLTVVHQLSLVSLVSLLSYVNLHPLPLTPNYHLSIYSIITHSYCPLFIYSYYWSRLSSTYLHPLIGVLIGLCQPLSWPLLSHVLIESIVSVDCRYLMMMLLFRWDGPFIWPFRCRYHVRPESYHIAP